MTDLAEKFKEALAKMSEEELKELIKKCEQYNGIGPTVDEYLKELNKQ